MNRKPQRQALTLNWLAWWHHGFWLQAEESWHSSSRFSLLSMRQQQRFLHQHASVFYRLLNIPATPLPAPQPMVLAMGALSVPARYLLLDVVACVCGTATPLPSSLKIWCQRLAKGIRVKSELPASLYSNGQHAGSLLLLHTLCPNQWSRLKFLFPKSAVSDNQPPPLALSESRLYTLWQAALWQSQQYDKANNHATDVNHVENQTNQLTG